MGARISVTVGFLVVFVAGTIGTAIPLINAVFGGWADRVLMQITDAFLALPYLMIAVTVISILKPSLIVVILVIGLLRWMDYARVLRGEVLRLAGTDFVHLAIVAGCSRWRIIGRHIFPNQVNSLLVLATLGVGSAVIAEATLSFLGLGIPRPQPSWGIMLAESQKYLYPVEDCSLTSRQQQRTPMSCPSRIMAWTAMLRTSSACLEPAPSHGVGLVQRGHGGRARACAVMAVAAFLALVWRCQEQTVWHQLRAWCYEAAAKRGDRRPAVTLKRTIGYGGSCPRGSACPACPVRMAITPPSTSSARARACSGVNEASGCLTCTAW